MRQRLSISSTTTTEEEELELNQSTTSNTSHATVSKSIANHPNQLLKAYICTYNCILATGWIYVTLVIVFKFLNQVSAVISERQSTSATPQQLLITLNEIFQGVFYNLFEELKTVIIALEVILLFDSVHGYMGLWGEDIVAPLINRWYCKVGRRAHLLLFALLVTPRHSIEHSPILGCVIFTWCLTDVVRYPFYALNMYRKAPYFLTFLRYTNFLVQYPLNTIVENIYVFWVLFPACAQPGALFRIPLTHTLVIHYGYMFIASKIRDNLLFPKGMKSLYEGMLYRLWPVKAVA